MTADGLVGKYEELKGLARDDLRAEATASLLADMAMQAWQFLHRDCEVVALTSEVPDKTYFGFRREAASRAINRALFVEEKREFRELLKTFRCHGLMKVAPAQATRAIYTIAFSVFAANDATNVGRKASATFFEILIGHVVARALGVNPRKKVRIPESDAELPTDFVFDLGRNKRKLHLPIKTSTRERGVQAWVHQLVLDRIFGSSSYRGLLVVAAETKRNSKTGVIVEICVPRQLQTFQSRLVEISRIYYLDPPAKYTALSGGFPKIEIKPFTSFFSELHEIVGA